jgi:hypothetical protein
MNKSLIYLTNLTAMGTSPTTLNVQRNKVTNNAHVVNMSVFKEKRERIIVFTFNTFLLPSFSISYKKGIMYIEKEQCFYC